MTRGQELEHVPWGMYGQPAGVECVSEFSLDYSQHEGNVIQNFLQLQQFRTQVWYCLQWKMYFDFSCWKFKLLNTFARRWGRFK